MAKPVESDEGGHPAEFFGTPNEPHSLFGEILDWMLAPLLFLWPLSIAATNHVATQIADQPYDVHLADSLHAIVQRIETKEARLTINASGQEWEFISTDGEDTIYFQAIPVDDPPPLDPASMGSGLAVPDDEKDVVFKDGDINGEEVRIAYRRLVPEGRTRPVQFQVAETRHKRRHLSSNIISGVLLPQFAIIPIAVVLVYLGLMRGLTPLNRLQERIRRRRPGDLSPINIQRVPEEMRPVIAAFNDMMARLEDNLEAQHRFIAAAAHQLKTPLTGLKTQTELALRETDYAQQREFLQRIAVGADRAAHLTRRLLQLARAEASHDKVHATERVDLDELAREVTETCFPRALAKGIDLGFEGAEWPLHIEGVPLLLREMVDNLVDNAIKYTPSEGRVTVRVIGGEEWRIEIEDTGIGIPAEERARVFERFYRVIDAAGEGTEGSGLGLAIVREIAELHRARVDLMDGESGRGTLFRIAFSPETKISSSNDDVK